MEFRTRFAPSPTGPLHLGHAYSAILAHDMARANDGTFLVRIEDIDQSRARPKWEDQIYDDLSWLGLSWDEPVVRQSTRAPAYQDAITKLWADGVLFPCDCTRRDISEAVSAPQENEPAIGPDGLIYPGTCRHHAPLHPNLPMPANMALRLFMSRAITQLREDLPLDFDERIFGNTSTARIDESDLASTIGDIVVSRHDMGTSYHLSVVLDDAAQGITDVVRGEDLFEATKIHVILQRLLGLATPTYHHHRLIRDDAGKRLAKRDDARAIRTYRDAGASPADIRQMVGLST